MSRESRLYLISVVTGAVYGLAMRGLLQFYSSSRPLASLIWVMSIAFVLVLPFSMGYLAVGIAARETRVGYAGRIFIPWGVSGLALLGCLVVAFEGVICVIMMAPIALLSGSLGGLTAGAIVRPSQRHVGTLSMAIVALLPFVVGPIEHRLPPPPEIRSVESDVVVHASPAVVWENIERVRKIDSAELPRSWNRSIGFPRPVEATLSHEGVGGVRHATFAGGVLFVETVDEWEPQRRLGFSIRADTANIPAGTLDEHVTVGGPYFNVLHGEYILEPADNGETRLRLVSRHRVSTDFNWYSRLWTDAVMRDVQRSILFVIKNRCQGGS